MAHVEGQRCGSGDVELEDAEDPCAYLSCVRQPDSLAMHHKQKEVCDRLERLDPSWRLRRRKKGPVNVLPTQSGPSKSVEFWVVV